MGQGADVPQSIERGCPLDRLLGFLAQAWMADVVWALGRRDALHFGALRRALGGRISARVLAHRLRQLQAQGLVSRAQRSVGRREAVYALTEHGRVVDDVLFRLHGELLAAKLPDVLALRR